MKLPDFVPRKLVFRLDEVADLLGVSTKTVRRWADAGVFGNLISTPGGKRVSYSGLALFCSAGDDSTDDTPSTNRI